MQLSFRRVPALAAIIFSLWSAAQAQAHPGLHFNGIGDGFNHPLHGWDHFLVMVAVGLWAAQQTGKARWLVPATFICVMAVGGLVGAAGLSLPGVEPMILVSVITLAALVLARRRLPLGVGMTIVGLFALFHGFAHGQEVPGAANLASFGLGFLAATALLHGVGYAAGRICEAIAERRSVKHADSRI